MNAIELERVAKVYRVYQSSRGILKELFLRRQYHRPFWALRELSVDVAPGVTLGVVGDNGAGKSTLLKLITGTTEPSSGSVRVKGRIASLLELGTGFHPEFTGRENIHFSAVTSGVSRQESREKIDEIIRFAELEDFIDQPIRTYSSGMYMRLGFAVATAFDPDVLVIDEALAVGDHNFQQKCIERIHRFKQDGRNIVFCSHNLFQVRRLCDRAVWLHRGECRASGEAAEVVERYTDFLRQPRDSSSLQQSASAAVEVEKDRFFSRIESVTLTDLAGRPREEFQTGEGLRLTMRVRFGKGFQPNLAVGLVRNDGLICYCTNTGEDKHLLNRLEGETYVSSIEFERLPLLSGRYHFSVATTDERGLQAYEIADAVCPFTVRHGGSDYGLIRLEHRWR
jgi:lipopolysaccharide transport system ATP-binding protein